MHDQVVWVIRLDCSLGIPERNGLVVLTRNRVAGWVGAIWRVTLNTWDGQIINDLPRRNGYVDTRWQA